jgi:hypothetical protein
MKVTETLGVLLLVVSAAACDATSGNIFSSIGNPVPTGAVQIITTALPSGVVGSAYSATVNAVGGMPPYHFSVTQGAVPAGLALAASGSISGAPTASGVLWFSVRASDSNVPPLTSAPQLLSILIASKPVANTTWYVRPDGGTRYSANVPTGQCDGISDAPYPGTGVNQHCAFDDFRFLYMDGSYGDKAWVIAGGDTVLVRGGPFRVGYDGPLDADYFGGCPGDPFGCTNPVIPPGTVDRHTQILGENYATCLARTQLFGGYGLGVVLDLAGATYVDVECLELTDHAQCSRVGTTPSACSSNYPLDDYASSGITTDASTANVLLQDLDIHGFTSRGIIGPIGGVVTVNRVRIGYNALAGWDFDDGNGTASVNGEVDASSLTIEWNGCDEEYPLAHATPAVSCYDENSGGYGDGIGTPSTPLTFRCDRCLVRNNTQDGFDLTHVTGNELAVTDSAVYANMGQQINFGPVTSVTMQNDLVVTNCNRMSAATATAPSTYNQLLSDFCRASGDGITIVLQSGETLALQNNSIVGYSATVFDISCATAGCSGASIAFQDNIVMGYVSPSYNAGKQPGAFYLQSATDASYFGARDHNIYFDVQGAGCPSTGHPDESCTDPLFVGEPVFTGESSLDDFDFALSANSPARAAGVQLPSVSTDYADNMRADPPSIGALEGP